MVPEARPERTEAGLVPASDGWFVVDVREARWIDRDGRGRYTPLTGWSDVEAESWFPQLGVNLCVLEPGQPMSMYHWEADQEDFLVLFGEATLVVEGQERALRRWDFFHCPVETRHVIVGAGNAPCVVLAVGARDHQTGPVWGGYTVDETAARHGASVDEETEDPEVAYSRFPPSRPTRYQPGWLPDA